MAGARPSWSRARRRASRAACPWQDDPRLASQGEHAARLQDPNRFGSDRCVSKGAMASASSSLLARFLSAFSNHEASLVAGNNVEKAYCIQGVLPVKDQKRYRFSVEIKILPQKAP